MVGYFASRAAVFYARGGSGMEKKIPIDIRITPENKCGFCTNSKCCGYITEQLATPRSMHDFDHLLLV